MKYDDIIKLVQYNKKDSTIFMPNEIFTDLKECINKAPHIAFAYSYVYFTTWLYRYTKYFNVPEIIDNKKIKEVLGYSSINQTMDYLIKKDGLLDRIGYLSSTKDFPISWNYDEYETPSLSFLSSSQVEKEFISYFPSIPKRYFLKYPVKAFIRHQLDNDEYEEGTFFNVSNTHEISFEVFLHCMSTEKIGCTGFYLYSFLRHKNDLFEFGYDSSIDNLSKDTGIPKRTVTECLSLLRSYKMIDVRHNQEFFVWGLDKSNRKANTYITMDWDFFTNTPSRFDRMKYKTKEEYELYLKEKDTLERHY